MALTLRAGGVRLAAGLIAGAGLSVSLYTYFNPPVWEADLEPGGFQHVKGYEYVVSYDVNPVFYLPSDRVRLIVAGPELQLVEDDRALGPARVPHVGITDLGEGRHSYRNRDLYFSSSDNSDPRRNGRRYRVVHPLYVSPLVVGAFFIVFVLAVTGIEPTLGFVRRAAMPAFAAAFGLVIALAGAELFLRSDLAKTKVLGPLGGYENFPERLRPKLNSLGYRDLEHKTAKPAGIVRILVLGDSMTFGHGVADDEIWPRRLAELAGPRVEVIAIAQNGWSTADQLFALRRDGLAFAPDFVVVGAVENDLGPPRWEPSGHATDWVLFSAVSDRLALFHWFDFALNRLVERLGLRRTYMEWLHDTFNPAQPFFPRWQQTLAEFGSSLRRAGIPGYAFVLTTPTRPSEEASVQRYETLRQEFAKYGFISANLQPAFVREYGPEGGKHLWALPNDSHPGPVVQEFFAREIWTVLAPAVQARLAAGGPAR
jgi:hypothetical protein